LVNIAAAIRESAPGGGGGGGTKALPISCGR
jgi:hypothetical protein